MRGDAPPPPRCFSRSSLYYTLNLLLQLRALGYGHVLLLGADLVSCSLLTGMLPRQACGW